MNYVPFKYYVDQLKYLTKLIRLTREEKEAIEAKCSDYEVRYYEAQKKIEQLQKDNLELTRSYLENKADYTTHREFSRNQQKFINM